uniref:Acetylcholinesterase n=1 Tax=Cyrtorhinus lividipennis TaxID=1032904 RepID=X5BXV0_9HEMI|nr:acetylcholinesterase 2 [Cyrtorhinus lividipennis]
MGRDVSIFLGVPFAKPPLGPLRFRRPVAMDPWHSVLDTMSLPNSCYQERYEYFPGFEGEEMWNPNTNISEDCLYLNLWVPGPVKLRHHGTNGEQNDDPNRKMPVLIWIYGGGYMSGTATLDVYDGLMLAASSGVIIASMQYRVGAFGFLYLEPYLSPGSDDAPGNMGLWDQTMAIRWIKENIHVFNGDPDLITLFGESAGGGSVSLHLISPVTRGLVRRGIMQSGTINAPWSYMTAERALEVGKQLVGDCGCNVSQLAESPSRVMACLRGVDSKTISTMQWNSYSGILGFPSAPTIDGHFLPKDPMELLKEGDFPETEILIGSNLDEGTYFLLYDFIDYFSKDNQVKLTRDKFLELVNTIFKNMTKLEREAIIFQYTNWDNIDDGYLNVKLISDIVGDYFFICPTNLFAENFAQHGLNVYYYYFMQRPTVSLWGEWMGVIHGDDIGYVFGHPLNMSTSYNARERDLSLRIMGAFGNFANTGKPASQDVNWPSYTKQEPHYFIFHAEESGIGRGPRATACAFWNDFFPRLKEHPGGCDCKDEAKEDPPSGEYQTSNSSDPDIGIQGSASTAVRSLFLCLLAALAAI